MSASQSGRAALDAAGGGRDRAPAALTSDADAAAIGEGLIACTLPRGSWTHAAHLTAAVYVLTRRRDLDPAEALPRLIRAYNEAVGVVEEGLRGVSRDDHAVLRPRRPPLPGPGGARERACGPVQPARRLSVREARFRLVLLLAGAAVLARGEAALRRARPAAAGVRRHSRRRPVAAAGGRGARPRGVLSACQRWLARGSGNGPDPFQPATEI